MTALKPDEAVHTDNKIDAPNNPVYCLSNTSYTIDFVNSTILSGRTACNAFKTSSEPKLLNPTKVTKNIINGKNDKTK